jgi:hypothetical protein
MHKAIADNVEGSETQTVSAAALFHYRSRAHNELQGCAVRHVSLSLFSGVAKLRLDGAEALVCGVEPSDKDARNGGKR